MGVDIKIINQYDNDNLWLSGNWMMDKFEKYLNISRTHGHKGKTIAEYLKMGMELLKEEGYVPRFSRVDEWGNAHDPNVDSWNDPDEYLKDQMCQLFRIMVFFLEKAEKYPNGRWYLDQNGEYSELLGQTPKENDYWTRRYNSDIPSDDEPEEVLDDSDDSDTEPDKIFSKQFRLPSEDVIPPALKRLIGIQTKEGITLHYAPDHDGRFPFYKLKEDCDVSILIVINLSRNSKIKIPGFIRTYEDAMLVSNFVSGENLEMIDAFQEIGMILQKQQM